MGSVRVAIGDKTLDVPYAAAPVEPTGPGIVSVRTLPGALLTDKLLAMPAKTKVSFPPGTFGDPNFDRPSNYRVYSVYAARAGALLGSGIDKTIIACPARTSTKASTVPAQGPGNEFPSATNPLITVRVDGDAEVANLTIRGYDQGHPYNGLQLYLTNGARVHDVKIKAIPGNAPMNPGETFSLALQRSIDTTVTRVEVDGTDDAGKKVAASGMGLNFVSGTTRLTSCNVHGMGWGAGVTAYQCNGTLIYDDLVSEDNVLPINFERCAASPTTVTINRPVFRRCSAKAADGQPVHAVIDSDFGSAKVVINDPTFDGKQFTVCIHSKYWTSAQRQLASDITLNVGGVPRPDLLRIVTNYTP